MHANQSERLAAETEQQREARLQRDREGQQQPQLPLLGQPSVQAKMRKFHSQVKKALMATPPLRFNVDRGDIVFSVQKLRPSSATSDCQYMLNLNT